MTEDYAMYMLGKKGIPIVNRLYGVPRDKMRFKKVPKQKGQNDTWKWHEFMNSKAMHAIYAGTRDVFTPMLSVPKISGRLWVGGEPYGMSIKPDAGFIVEPPGYERLTHYRETDTGEKPSTRTVLLTQQSILQNLLVYLDALKRGEEFVVAVVTKSRKRVFNMIGDI